ncbi:MAG: DUF2304 domain-containing protein [Micrococcales bacterium]|nr:DUF2304 domain-containing protein [Micrococcales bacterium]
MTLFLQVALLVVCLLTFVFIIRRVRKAQVQISDSVFWITLSLILLFISLVPQWVERLAELAGVADPTNFVFLTVIFLLLIKLFSASIQISRLDAKVNHLVQQVAISQMSTHEEIRQLVDAQSPDAAGPAQRADRPVTGDGGRRR